MKKNSYQKQPILIASGADNRYALPLGVTLYSALANLSAGRTVFLYILDGGISEKNRCKLTRVLNLPYIKVHLEWLQPDLSLISDVKTSKWHSHAAYLRLLLPSLLPQQIDRILYLDCDLVVEKNLGLLWEMELDDHCALAVQDYWNPYVSCPDALPATYQKLGLAHDTPYCNTGVMMINLKAWREEEISHKVLEYTQKFRQYVHYADQDGINAIIAGRWGRLNPKWNVMIHIIESYGKYFSISHEERRHAQEAFMSDPYILHFTSRMKPWQYLYRCRRKARFRFFHYLKTSNWFTPLRYTQWSLCRKTSQFLIIALGYCKRFLLESRS